MKFSLLETRPFKDIINADLFCMRSVYVITDGFTGEGKEGKEGETVATPYPLRPTSTQKPLSHALKEASFLLEEVQ
jgi:hypothetical protein